MADNIEHMIKNHISKAIAIRVKYVKKFSGKDDKDEPDMKLEKLYELFKLTADQIQKITDTIGYAPDYETIINPKHDNMSKATLSKTRVTLSNTAPTDAAIPLEIEKELQYVM